MNTILLFLALSVLTVAPLAVLTLYICGQRERKNYRDIENFRSRPNLGPMRGPSYKLNIGSRPSKFLKD